MIIIRRDGTVSRLDTMDLGFPIGLEENIGDFVSMTSFPFQQGDMIVLFTDGITEAEGETGELYGIERLVALGTSGACTRRRGGDRCHHRRISRPYRNAESS